MIPIYNRMPSYVYQCLSTGTTLIIYRDNITYEYIARKYALTYTNTLWYKILHLFSFKEYLECWRHSQDAIAHKERS